MSLVEDTLVQIVAKTLCRRDFGVGGWDVDYRTEEGHFAPLWSTYLGDATDALTDVRGFSAIQDAGRKALSHPASQSPETSKEEKSGE